MTKESKKSAKDQVEPEEKTPIVPIEENIQETLPESAEEEPTQIASKQFVKILREEFKKENISESIYKAFLNSVPKVDWEKNYRLIWETTFKRPPGK